MRFYRKWACTYLQNDSYLISNSPYTIKLASKLKLSYSTFNPVGWSVMQIPYLICIFINIDDYFRK